jgi:hypothetical protein
VNRRNFLCNILVAGASFTILPGAGRIWKAQRQLDLKELFDLQWKIIERRKFYSIMAPRHPDTVLYSPSAFAEIKARGDLAWMDNFSDI